MRQATNMFHLGGEPLLSRFVELPMRGDALDRNQSFQFRMTAKIDLPHAAPTEWTYNFVVPDLLG